MRGPGGRGGGTGPSTWTGAWRRPGATGGTALPLSPPIQHTTLQYYPQKTNALFADRSVTQHTPNRVGTLKISSTGTRPHTRHAAALPMSRSCTSRSSTALERASPGSRSGAGLCRCGCPFPAPGSVRAGGGAARRGACPLADACSRGALRLRSAAAVRSTTSRSMSAPARKTREPNRGKGPRRVREGCGLESGGRRAKRERRSGNEEEDGAHAHGRPARLEDAREEEHRPDDEGEVACSRREV